MGQWRGLGLALLGLSAGLVVGCTTPEAVRSTTWLRGLPSFRGPTGPDTVQLEWALLERPIGDRYLDQGLWDQVNEQVIALERKDILEDNGFRVAQIGGLLPDELQNMLTSERNNASARRRQLRASDSVTIPLGPARAQCRFQLKEEERAELVTLEQAQLAVVVTPTLTNDSQTRLQFTPQITHGDTKLIFKPDVDGSRWALQGHLPTETYARQGWEVTLATNEYVLIGGRFDHLQTLGNQCFVRSDEPRPVQRLLVIRTGRYVPGVASEMVPDSTAEDCPSPRPTPLAMQAAVGTIRSTSPP
jgi:hypothetical protein